MHGVVSVMDQRNGREKEMQKELITSYILSHMMVKYTTVVLNNK